MKVDIKKIQSYAPFILIAFVLLGLKALPIMFFLIAVFIIFRKIKKNNINGDVLQSKAFFNGNNYNQHNMDGTIKDAVINGGGGKLLKSAILLVILLVLFFSSIVIVGAGETGVYSLFGKVRDGELKSGFHLVNPLGSVNKMSIRTEEYTMSKASVEGKKVGDDSITALTKEGLTVSMDVTTFYHLDEDKASDLYREVGLTYEEKIIRPEIRSAIREMVAQYEAKDIYSEKRGEAAINILKYLNDKVRDRGIVIEDLLIRDVTLPPNLSQAIQEKLKAEQESQRYDFVLDKEKKEAERKVIEAQGQRDAQQIIDESLSAKYLDYLYINGLKDRQGTIYVPTNGSTGMPMFKGIE